MATHNPELHIRALNPEQDVPLLVQLRAEIEAADQSGANTSEAGLRAQFE